MKDISGSTKSLRDLLQNKKYTLHYYQREFRWQRKHIEELIDDLTTEFLIYYKPEHERPDVEKYGVYFMGSIILAGDENALVDGQQRLSSLTLLLTYLNNRLTKRSNVIDSMIFSELYDKKSFNINVPERQNCMTAIYENALETFDDSNASESVKNLCERYRDIVEIFSSKTEMTDAMIPYFCDWLIQKVFFMEISVSTEQDAHKIFETMNDRGLNLTPTEMLKGYVLSKIEDDTLRENLNAKLKEKISLLKKDDDKGDESFIRAWLRAQYAENNDFDAIGGAFHRWVRDDKYQRLNLATSNDFEQFIEDFCRFADFYIRIKQAEKFFDVSTKYVYYNAQLNFTLQPQLLMAALCRDDDDAVVTQKINLVARFIDLMIHARVMNYRSVEQRFMKQYIFSVGKGIRRVSVDELKPKLKFYYDNLEYDTVNIQALKLNNFTKRYIKNILARITSFIEEQTNTTSNYLEYMKSQGKNLFGIEHIIGNDFEKFGSDFADKTEFNDYRDSIGALVLLRGSINSSLGKMDYAQKISTYCSTTGNIYAASLGEQTYHNNPPFIKFISENNLPFKPFKKFGKDEIQERVGLVVELVKLIWNTKEFD